MKRRTFKKLVMFCTRPRVCPEMKAEVVKQAAREVAFDQSMDLKITLSIQGWGDPEIFAIDGHRFKEVTKVEQKVGAHANIVSVLQHNKKYPWACRVLDEEIVERILAREERHLGELDKLELSRVDLSGETDHENLLLSLMETSKEWRVELLIIEDMKDILATLARISNTGRIRFLIFNRTGPSWLNEVNLEDVRKGWEISEAVGLGRKLSSNIPLFGGGMSVAPMEEEVEERWQRMVHFAQTGNHEENQEEEAV